MDVYIWLLCRKSIGKADLERIGNYVIGNKEERRDFEQFRDSLFYQSRPMLKTPLLVEFMHQRKIVPLCNFEHGIEFIYNFPKGLLDDLCNWAKRILHNETDGLCLDSNKSGIVINQNCLYLHYVFAVNSSMQLPQDKSTEINSKGVVNFKLF